MINIENLNKELLPQHIAVIMDGNGRWAKKQGAARVFGHRNAIAAVRDTVEACAELGVNHLSLYAFSTENWGRPKLEVNALMSLLVSTIRQETKTLQDNRIKLNAIGEIASLPKSCQRELSEAIEITRDNDQMTLTLALSYSGKWDVTQAMQQIAKKVSQHGMTPEDINEDIIAAHLSTAQLPDPELLIRTSGEMRISNFMLWQSAYTELYFTEVLWPDFRREHLFEAIKAYQGRDRRFGKIKNT